MNKLEQLKQYTTVVADTGDITAIKQYQPLDATTNPSLLLKAAAQKEYQPLLKEAVNHARRYAQGSLEQPQLAADKFATLIGREVTQIIEGRVSTEVDARLSFDTRATIEKARQLIRLYQQIGVERSRIYIKIAATWEGIQAARVLEQEGINCNLTLLFCMEQARACADAGVSLISPFVGRIYDWHLASSGKDTIPAEQDPGVLSVRAIFDYYKSHGYNTIIMGASFRNTGQIEALTGCDYLTISPQLLQELSEDKAPMQVALEAERPSAVLPAQIINEADFRYALNTNAMACDKLADGIRRFADDQQALEDILEKYAD